MPTPSDSTPSSSPTPAVPIPQSASDAKPRAMGVAEAFGLPSSWTSANAEPEKPAAAAEKPEPTPEPGKADAAEAAKAPATAAEPEAPPAVPETPVPVPTKPEVAPAKPAEDSAIEAEVQRRLAEGTSKPLVTAVTPAPAPVEKTKEQIAAEQEETVKKDAAWISETSKHVRVDGIDEASLDKILTGGPEAVQTLQTLLRENAAQAVLMARKSLLNDVLPQLQQIADQQRPVLENFHKAEAERHWSSFETKYPELKGQRDIVETVGKALLETGAIKPTEVTPEQFYERVADGTKKFLARFQPATAPAAAPVPAEAKATAAVPATTPVPPRAKVQPPGANIPSPRGTSARASKMDVSSMLPP